MTGPLSGAVGPPDEGAEPRRDYDVFISYRRGQNLAASLFHSELCRRGWTCFRDDAEIPTGTDWAAEIDRALHSCHLVLVVMNENFLTLEDGGFSRIKTPGDVFAREIATALQLRRDGRVDVVPALIGGARMPDKASLPEGLKGLPQVNGVAAVLDPEIGDHVRILLEKVDSMLRARGITPRATATTATATTATAATVAIAATAATDVTAPTAPPDQVRAITAAPVDRYEHPYVPPPAATTSGEGVIGVLWHANRLRIVRLQGAVVSLEDLAGASIARSLPVSGTSGSVADDGSFAAIGTADQLMIVATADDGIRFGPHSQVPMGRPVHVLSSRHTGPSVSVLVSSEEGLGQVDVVVASGEPAMHPVGPGSGPSPWRSAVQTAGGFAAVDGDGILHAAGVLGTALSGVGRSGWRSLDTAMGTDDVRAQWVLGLRDAAPDRQELVVARLEGAEWSPARQLAVGAGAGADRAILTHPVPRSAPSVHLFLGAEMRSWQMADLLHDHAAR